MYIYSFQGIHHVKKQLWEVKENRTGVIYTNYTSFTGQINVARRHDTQCGREGGGLCAAAAFAEALPGARACIHQDHMSEAAAALAEERAAAPPR